MRRGYAITAQGGSHYAAAGAGQAVLLLPHGAAFAMHPAPAARVIPDFPG